MDHAESLFEDGAFTEEFKDAIRKGSVKFPKTVLTIPTSKAVKDPSKNNGKSWMYTLNNYTPEDEVRLQAIDCNYHVYGREIGESGTPHLQGCITFARSCRFAGVHKLIPGHLTRPNSLQDARNYCMKDNDFFLKDRTKQGARQDLEDVCEYIKDGHSIKQTAMKFSSQYVKYHGGFLQLTRLIQNVEPRTTKPIVHWYYGSTGTGKTRAVFESEPDLWLTADSFTHFNGYRNQRASCFDDFRASFCKFRTLLRLLDRYPCTVNIKYGEAEWNSDRIYITSDKSPYECYSDSVGDINQLIRRIDNIVEFMVDSGGAVTYKWDKGEFRPGPPPVPGSSKGTDDTSTPDNIRGADELRKLVIGEPTRGTLLDELSMKSKFFNM